MKKKAFTAMAGIGFLSACIGGAGLDGATSNGCMVVVLAGMVLLVFGLILTGICEEEENAKRKEERRLRAIRNETYRVWKSNCSF